jgi:transcriptional regulator with XRE-family HTH domain
MDARLIKIIRKSKGINLIKLSELTGLSRYLLARIENNKGNPSLESFVKVCNVLDIKIILTI